MPKKNMTQLIQRQALKDEKLQQIEQQAAESAIQALIDEDFQLKAKYEEERVRLDFTLNSGKVITLKVDYENLSGGFDNIKAFISKLDR